MPMTDADPSRAPAEDAAAPDLHQTQSLGYLARYAHYAFREALERELAPHGIRSAQWSVLRILWDTEGLTQAELAERMRVEKTSLTGVLDGMERGGFILRARNAGDRRKINIRLTARGRRLKAELLPYVAKINRQATRGMSEDEVAQLRRALAWLTANLES